MPNVSSRYAVGARSRRRFACPEMSDRLRSPSSRDRVLELGDRPARACSSGRARRRAPVAVRREHARVVAVHRAAEHRRQLGVGRLEVAEVIDGYRIVKSMPSSSRRSYSSAGRCEVARSRTLRVCQPHHDGIARHCARTVGVGAVGEHRRRVDRRDAALARYRSRSAAPPASSRYVSTSSLQERADLDEVAVGVDDRMVELAADLRGVGARCGHASSIRPAASAAPSSWHAVEIVADRLADDLHGCLRTAPPQAGGDHARSPSTRHRCRCCRGGTHRTAGRPSRRGTGSRSGRRSA